jgi:uncharacterized protein with FMN-binding domain
MIFGFLTFMLCLVLLLTFFARKLGLERLNSMSKKIHKPAGIAVLATVMLHLLSTLNVWDTRAVMVVATGIAACTVIVFMTIAYLFKKKFPRTWMKYHRAGAVIACILIVLHIAGYYVDYRRYQDKIGSIHLDGVTAQGVRDGTYYGEYDAGFIYAKVAVEVENGQILNLTLLEHDNERGARAAAVAEDIVAVQITKVDAVSGATNSSKVIMKAAENALISGT